MSIPLNIQCYAPGVAGVPSTAVPVVPGLREKIDSYQHSISDRFGFESCNVSMKVSLDEGLSWLNNGLMRQLIVTGPDAQIVWEGFLETITLHVGQKKASLSLRGMANRVRVLWTTEQGGPGDTPISAIPESTLSQSLFGIKDYAFSLPKVKAAQVLNAGAKVLTALALPRSIQASDATTGGLGEFTLELSFAGWYATTEWVLVSNSSVNNTVTNTQIISTYIPALAATNPFLSTDTSGITFTGPLMTEYVAHYSTFKQVFDRLLAMGDSANDTVAYGVFEGRKFQAVTSDAATPTVITYNEDASTGIITDTYGNQVMPWDVRPNNMSQIVQLIDSGPATGAIDAAARKYVSRVTCSIQGDSIGCTLEPGGAGGLDAIMAAFPPIYYWRG